LAGGFSIAQLSGRARAAEECRRQEALARRRMLIVADEERQRVVRDLHDGAQQRLVAAVAVLRAANSTPPIVRPGPR
jgi:signal transduction histidine kinase